MQSIDGQVEKTMSWKVQTFQVVWFPEKVSGLSALALFEALIGAPPDASSSNRAPTTQAPFFSQASGISEGLLHNIRVAPGRVDWKISVPEKENDAPYTNLMEIAAGIDLIQRRIAKVGAGLIAGVTRLSIITSLRWPVSGIGDANAMFFEMCKLPIKGDGLQDLIFQINCRRQLSEKTMINRIGKFATETVSQVLIQFDAKTGQSTQMSPMNAAHFSASVTLDFNTVPTGERIPDDQQVYIFNEIIKDTIEASNNPSIEFFSG